MSYMLTSDLDRNITLDVAILADPVKISWAKKDNSNGYNNLYSITFNIYLYFIMLLIMLPNDLDLA